MRYHYTVQDARPEEQLIWASMLNTYGTRTISDFTEDRKGNYWYQYCKMASLNTRKQQRHPDEQASLWFIPTCLLIKNITGSYCDYHLLHQTSVRISSSLRLGSEQRTVKRNMNMTSSYTVDHQRTLTPVHFLLLCGLLNTLLFPILHFYCFPHCPCRRDVVIPLFNTVLFARWDLSYSPTFSMLLKKVNWEQEQEVHTVRLV